MIGWNDRATDQVRVQTYDDTGNLLNDTISDLPQRTFTQAGREFTVDLYAARVTAATALEDGGFSITWDAQHSGILAQYGGGSSSFTQTFDATGTALSAPRQIMPWNTGSTVSDAAALSDDRYVVVMSGGDDAPNNDSDKDSPLGRIFDSSGAAVTDYFMLNQSTDISGSKPSVATLENGDFVAVWTGETNAFWRRFDSDGTPVTGEVPLDDNYYVEVRATAMPDDGFMITARYSGYNPSFSTYAYRFDADNELVDERVTLTTRRSPDPDSNFYKKPVEFAVLGNDQLLGLIEAESLSPAGRHGNGN